jgi:hypothetical protein
MKSLKTALVRVVTFDIRRQLNNDYFKNLYNNTANTCLSEGRSIRK